MSYDICYQPPNLIFKLDEALATGFDWDTICKTTPEAITCGSEISALPSSQAKAESMWQFRKPTERFGYVELVEVVTSMAGLRFLIPIFIAINLAGWGSLPHMVCAGDDFLDSFDQIEPDATERPQEPVIDLPGSLDNYLQASKPNSLASASDEESLSRMIRWLVLKNLPPSYEDNRGWGKQKKVYDGFRFRNEGLKVETYRKYKTVKHGTWKRYHIELVDPQSNLQIHLRDLRNLSNDRFAFHLTLETPLKVFGRISQWQRDVQLISISTNASVAVQVEIDAECNVQMNPLVFPPDMQFVPTVTKATVRLTKMEVDRISQIRGDIAEELGKCLRGFVDEYLREYDDKLVVKINKQLDKQKDKLRVATIEYLPKFIQSTATP
jgi:hypothetical protein